MGRKPKGKVDDWIRIISTSNTWNGKVGKIVQVYDSYEHLENRCLYRVRVKELGFIRVWSFEFEVLTADQAMAEIL